MSRQLLNINPQIIFRYEVQTNYDHWKQPPWFDDRVVPANDAMTAMGQTNLSLENLFKVSLPLLPLLPLPPLPASSLSYPCSPLFRHEIE
jgi:hypothetical protein